MTEWTRQGQPEFWWVSAGIDSAVVAVLAQRAMGDHVLGLLLPCFSLPEDEQDGMMVADTFEIRRERVDLSPVYEAFLRQLPEAGKLGDPVEGTAGAEGLGEIMSAYLEQSTTEAVAELVELIKVQRIFQMNSQTIQAANDALQTVANLRR